MTSDALDRLPRPWRLAPAGRGWFDIEAADGEAVFCTVETPLAQLIVSAVNAHDPHNDPILPMIARRLGEVEAMVERINETLVAAGQMPREVCE